MPQKNHESQPLKVQNIKISELKAAQYNPRKWSPEAIASLTQSIEQFGLVDPILSNGNVKRKNIVIGGHFRLKVAKDLGYKEVPVVYLDIPDELKEKELNLRLNKNLGDWDYGLLAEFDESLLADVGFDSQELDDIFDIDLEEADTFDLEKELKKLDITKITAEKGDIYKLGDSRLMVGDSTVRDDIQELTDGEHADMCMTDPPYILDYLHAKRGGKPVTGFGAKKNRRYLETEELPDDFTELWMANIAEVAKPDFSIIVYENWKNLRVIWGEMEKHWNVKNMIVWHLANRHQNFASNYKFFSKHDIAMVGSKGTVKYNHDEEPDGLYEEYQTALYAITGKPQWEAHAKDKKYMPTDFIEHTAEDEKHSGQGVIFGTKPIPILIPYIKVLTKRGDLVVEPFCGSGSTLVASTILKRRCYVMEKSPVYAEVAMKRWEKLTGLKRQLVTRGSDDKTKPKKQK
ncbi:MAG TPA: DNA modification methylase [Candidatus Saccharibacteria bacterium]|nr:DNA modification methylase [Candidatus Saccharibacteria bacterium]